SKEIAEACKKQLNRDIDKKKIVIKDQIKALGNYIVDIKVHTKVTAQLTVKVVEAK
ncbi:MAG: 50S ribosomal protein L9, partial [Lachnospiraceae bacterium]|nr:50S ribosomal protein L9 [Lachnospiraceae bacterium]